MTVVCNITPPKPKLSSVWNVDILFKFFEQQGDDHLFPDKVISQKLLTLLLLIGSHTLSTIKSFTVDNMIINVLSVTFSLMSY